MRLRGAEGGAFVAQHQGRARIAVALAAGLGAASLAPASHAHAQDRYEFPTTPSLELHAGFAWWGEGFAAGARVGLPVAYGWLSPNVGNTLSVTLGADFYFIRDETDNAYGPGVGIPVTLEWRLHFMPLLSLFAELGVNVFLPSPAFASSPHWDYPGAWFVGAIGAEIHVSRTVSLVARLGAPYSTLGISFLF